jgi:hypothetical protein
VRDASEGVGIGNGPFFFAYSGGPNRQRAHERVVVYATETVD